MKTNVINIDSQILNGTPVFLGTRVPIDTLFDHLETGLSVNEFLSEYPSVKREQAITLLEIASGLVSSKNIKMLYENSFG